MFEQAAPVAVVHVFGPGRLQEPVAEVRMGKHLGAELAPGRVGDLGPAQLGQPFEQHFGRLGAAGHELGQVRGEFLGGQHAQPVDVDLGPVAVGADLALDQHELAGPQVGIGLGGRAPDLGLDLAGDVFQGQGPKRSVFRLGKAGRAEAEDVGDGLSGDEVGEKAVFFGSHGHPGWKKGRVPGRATVVNPGRLGHNSRRAIRQTDASEARMRILLTNDDGIHAVGIRDLHKGLVAAGHEVHVVAPLTEQSAVGHAITIAMPLRVKEFRENGFRGLGVSGTPADCVKLALTTLLADRPPDVVVSGINAGPNVGMDILYSGTVSAATEGALMGYPAVAVSADDFAPTDLTGQGAYAARFISGRPWEIAPPRCVLNLNFPNRPVEQTLGLKLCAPTPAIYADWYDTRQDPRGRTYYWLTGIIPPEKLTPDCDRSLLTEGYITLSPLRFDLTDRETMARLADRLGLDLTEAPKA